MKWPKIEISTAHGIKSGIAPIVISASRATDIPAFHAQWFMNRIEAGYCLWQNAFNSKQQQYVSFAKCKVLVFWTKHPAALMPYLEKLDELGYKYYFQYTINDYEHEGLEPKLPSLQKRLETFQELSEKIGKHRVLWRFDPIILSDSLTIEKTLKRFENIAKTISPFTEKCVFSFVDWYKKTQTHLKKANPSYRAPSIDEMLLLAHSMVQINNELTHPIKMATCAEQLNLDKLGITHNKCIDQDLLLRLCPNDIDMLKLCGDAYNAKQLTMLPMKNNIKDSGQRSSCGCAPSKDIGSYNSCLHFCKYCYANQSEQTVLNKIQNLTTCNERI